MGLSHRDEALTMAKLYVGCRVRIKWSTHFPELAGEVGTITDKASDGGLDGTSDWMVAPDCWGSPKSPTTRDGNIGFFAPNSDQLEPATDSYDKIEWSECIWAPEHLREKV
jgi:hypothetical protein